MSVSGEVEADLWQFALAVYGTEGVSDDCLRLQDTYNVDVPVILCALWMATQGRRLDKDGVAHLVAATKPWHNEVVIALRAVRRRLKQGPPPAPNAQTEVLRDAVKAAELQAERLELATLADLAVTDFAPGDQTLPIQNLKAALHYFAGDADCDDAPIDRLVRAVEVVSSNQT